MGLVPASARGVVRRAAWVSGDSVVPGAIPSRDRDYSVTSQAVPRKRCEILSNVVDELSIA